MVICTPNPWWRSSSTGRYLPERVLTNHRSGSHGRYLRRVDPGAHRDPRAPDRRAGEGAADMACRAATAGHGEGGHRAGGGGHPHPVSTATPDRLLPSTACDLQAILGAGNAMAFDLAAACSGLALRALLGRRVTSARARGEIALVVATEKMSAIVDWEDRATCVLFGDGSGAAVLRRATGDAGILSESSPVRRHLGEPPLPAGRRSGDPHVPRGSQASKDHLLKMSGREVFKNAVRSMAEASDMALQQAGLTGRRHRSPYSSPGQHPDHRCHGQVCRNPAWRRST